jgi:hypothetical protein
MSFLKLKFYYYTFWRPKFGVSLEFFENYCFSFEIAIYKVEFCFHNFPQYEAAEPVLND